jgi:hypothetical protein
MKSIAYDQLKGAQMGMEIYNTVRFLNDTEPFAKGDKAIVVEVFPYLGILRCSPLNSHLQTAFWVPAHSVEEVPNRVRLFRLRIQGDRSVVDLVKDIDEVHAIIGRAVTSDDELDLLTDVEDQLVRKVIATPSFDEEDLSAKLRLAADIIDQKRGSDKVVPDMMRSLSPDYEQCLREDKNFQAEMAKDAA